MASLRQHNVGRAEGRINAHPAPQTARSLKVKAMFKRSILPLLAAAALLGATGAAAAAEYKVQMLNNGSQGMMAFEPGVLKIKVGDTVRFTPTDMGHNAEMITGAFPAGVTLAKGAMGKELVVKFTKPGIYAFRCLPHYGMGMVALIQVGDGKVNRAQVEAALASAPPMAKKRFAADFVKLN